MRIVIDIEALQRRFDVRAQLAPRIGEILGGLDDPRVLRHEMQVQRDVVHITLDRYLPSMRQRAHLVLDPVIDAVLAQHEHSGANCDARDQGGHDNHNRQLQSDIEREFLRCGTI